MYKNNFYVTLPSNSSLHYYPDNTLAKYTTKLHRRIILDSTDWEVALVEIQYPTLFETITDSKDMWIQYSGKLPNGYYEMRKSILPQGIYDKEDSLAEKLNRELKDFEIKFQKDMNRFIVQYNSADVENVLMSNSIGQLLGFCLPNILKTNEQFTLPVEASKFLISVNQVNHKHDTIKETSTEDTNMIAEAPYPPKLTHCSPTHMYIYTDIIEPNLVGDCIAPLLRIVKVQKQTTDTNISTSFSNPYYLPVLKREFDTIEIHLRDDEGQLIPFISGKLNVRLHFRRVQNGF
ncbi:unnamed protein product [Brugia timori]|uniref:C2 domain-containing protein n=1 Tax=Brugia timori TaxID=42155 RepID=A0A0R3QAL6_9BILA|nr:unnamed protein product [Brugia timori]